MGTHNMCFRGEIKKNIVDIPLLSVAMLWGRNAWSILFATCCLLSTALYKKMETLRIRCYFATMLFILGLAPWVKKSADILIFFFLLSPENRI